MFQHTAARRRLVEPAETEQPAEAVSTHSRPKAAEGSTKHLCCNRTCFNTQPPEGG